MGEKNKKYFSYLSMFLGILLIIFTIYLILYKDFRGNDLQSLYMIIGLLFLLGFLGYDFIDIIKNTFKVKIEEKIENFIRNNESLINRNLENKFSIKIENEFEEFKEKIFIQKKLDNFNDINKFENELKEEEKGIFQIIKSISDKNKNIELFRREGQNVFGLRNDEIGQFVIVGDGGICIKIGAVDIIVQDEDRDKEGKVKNIMNNEFNNFLEENGLEYFSKNFKLSAYGKSLKTVKNYRWIENKSSKNELLKNKELFEKELKKMVNFIIKKRD